MEVLTGNLQRAENLARELFTFDVQLPLDAETCDQFVGFHLNPVHEKDEALIRVLSGAHSGRARERDANTNRWQSLVCDYTLRDLSYCSDTLPALSGAQSSMSLQGIQFLLVQAKPVTIRLQAMETSSTPAPLCSGSRRKRASLWPRSRDLM